MPAKILTIVGPTASGKTRLAVELAQRFNGEVVSCDSMQIYRHMDIGTAKPTAAEMAGIPHHMLDVADPDENYSAARYVEQASACVDDILSRGKLPIIAGGTGLYRDALLAGRTFASFSGKYRDELQRQAAEGQLPQLFEQLRQIDPERAEKLHLADEKRILRALEVWYETGKTITQHDEESRLQPPRYDAVFSPFPRFRSLSPESSAPQDDLYLYLKWYYIEFPPAAWHPTSHYFDSSLPFPPQAFWPLPETVHHT